MNRVLYVALYLLFLCRLCIYCKWLWISSMLLLIFKAFTVLLKALGTQMKSGGQCGRWQFDNAMSIYTINCWSLQYAFKLLCSTWLWNYTFQQGKSVFTMLSWLCCYTLCLLLSPYASATFEMNPLFSCCDWEARPTVWHKSEDLPLFHTKSQFNKHTACGIAPHSNIIIFVSSYFLRLCVCTFLIYIYTYNRRGNKWCIYQFKGTCSLPCVPMTEKKWTSTHACGKLCYEEAAKGLTHTHTLNPHRTWQTVFRFH